MQILVAYATTDGQTAVIARRVGDHIRKQGHVVTVADIRQLPEEVPPRAYDAVILGGSLHARGYQRRLGSFVQHNRPLLRSVPTAFISVCLAAASKKPREREGARTRAQRFVASLGWQPDVIEVVAGALTFSRYGFLRRSIMRRIAVREMGLPVDVRHDHELTDWSQVERFANAFVERATGATARPVAPPVRQAR